MPGIFISYRREDSIGHTGRLYDLLSQHFGRAHVFMDIDTIGPGEDFSEVIERTCESCEVLLAMIGRSWATVADLNGTRRLDNPEDFVRREIAHALGKGIRVVPVLVDGAQMPDAKVLPDDLRKLALRNAWEINDKRFHHDVGQLIESLQKMQPALRPLPTTPEMEPKTASSKIIEHLRRISRKRIYAGIGGATVVLLLAFIVFLNRSKSTPATTNPTQTTLRGYDIPSLQATVTAPLLFFVQDPGRAVPPPGQRPYFTSLQSAQSYGKQIFWEVSLNFQGQFPPPDYEIESVWFRNNSEVFRAVGNYRGASVSGRAFHNRYSWSPPEKRLAPGQYRVDLYVTQQRITSGSFTVFP